jgi:hypothetical protein
MVTIALVRLAPSVLPAVLVLTYGCTETSKTVAGDITLTWFEGAYYLRHKDVEPELLGFGPLEALGWNSEVVAACAERSGCRVVDVKTHRGWTQALSRDEVNSRTNSMLLLPPKEAWGRLRGWPPW